MVRQHTEEFRSKAVQLAFTSGLSRKQVAGIIFLIFVRPRTPSVAINLA